MSREEYQREWRQRNMARNSAPDAPTFESKVCPRCGEDKPRSEYGNSRSRRDGAEYACRPCTGAYYKKYRARLDRTQEARRSRLRRYGITPEQYDEILAFQGDRCAICQTDHPGGPGKYSWNVDHCHETGQVRGLLCLQCNAGIGKLRDSPTLVHAALRYLLNPPTKELKCLSPQTRS